VLPRTYDPATRLWGNLYNSLLEYVISAALIFYVLTVAGVFRLRIVRPDAERPYRTFGYPMVPGLYILAASAILFVLFAYRPATTWPACSSWYWGFPSTSDCVVELSARRRRFDVMTGTALVEVRDRTSLRVRLERFPEDRTGPRRWIRHWGYTEAGGKFFVFSFAGCDLFVRVWASTLNRSRMQSTCSSSPVTPGPKQ
jgi:amino acid transporter